MDYAVAALDRPSPELARSVLAAVDATARADGVSPVSEQGRILLRDGREGPVHLLARPDGGAADGPVLGYAQLVPSEDGSEPPSAELFTVPDQRGRGIGTALLAAVRGAANGPFLVWAHGARPEAARLAERAGLTAVRELRQMRRPLTAADAGPSPLPLPDGVTVRTFRPGQDEEAWLALNAAAFAHHPEQGGWTRADLDARLAEDWFDPAGFFLAERGAGTPDARLVGFHWTKIHHGENLGEVYVVGVAPGEQGGGLGKSLTDIGVRHLASQGLPGVLLYVDADNTAAVRVYERLGFTVHAVDVMYRG